MKLTNNIIALVMAALILTGVAMPSLQASAFIDENGDAVVPLGYLSGDGLDGMTLKADVSGGHVSVSSDLWNGVIARNAIIVHTDKGSVYTDGSAVFSIFGNTVRTYPTSVTVTLDGGTITVGAVSVPVTFAYWPNANGLFGSYVNATLTDPIGAVGAFAGVTVGGSDTDITNNTSGYVLEPFVDTDDRKAIGFGPGEVDIPKVDPFLPDIEHEDDPEPEPVEPGEIVSSGTTGSCTWELDGTVLYVSGEGGMGSYTDSSPAPWGKGITAAVLHEGVTSIGQKTFIDCKELVSMSLPSTLMYIRGYALYGCSSLSTLELSHTALTTVADSSLRRMTSLTELVLPESVTYFGLNAINGCSALHHLYIPPTATTISSQAGFSFIRLDGYDMGTTPTGDLYLGSEKYVMYQTITEIIDGATYHINYVGAELETATNSETVHVPYRVTYNNKEYTVESIAHNAISGNAVRNVVIPQTVESISSTAITAPSVREILNLSETEVVSASGMISTEIASMAIVAEKALGDSYNTYALLIGVVVIVCLVGMAVKLLPMSRNDWE